MRVKDLRQYLEQFVKGSDAINNAVIFVEKNGKLHEIKRMEVHENAHPIVGFGKTMSHRLVLKTERAHRLLMPEKLMKDY
jgi:hypothetical protein|tara:strand:- start:4 stop:243 length:240 start_codon:yes stop_codon:yes gene_type:complete